MATAAERKRREERVKLAAQAVSNIGVAAIVGGDVGPLLIGRFNAVVAVVAFRGGHRPASRRAAHFALCSGRSEAAASDVGAMTELQSILWFLIATPIGIGIMLWGTFAMIHADEAKGRRREEDLRKRQSTDG